MVEVWVLHAVASALCFASAACFVAACSGKKQQASGSREGRVLGGATPPQPPPKPPAIEGVAGTYDPNYQTLAGVKGDVFGADNKNPGPLPPPGAPERPIRPATGGVAGTNDPNYQTLAGVKDVFDNKQVPGGAPAPPPPPQIRPGAGGEAGACDPNYQTLAGMGGDIFDKNKKL